MTGVIHIPEGERGHIRVFSLEMPPEQARFLREPGALAQVLGIDEIDLDHVEVFPLRDLEDLGLAGYLTEGCGIPAKDIAPDREMLNGLEGHILLLRSRAFQGNETRLTPADQIISVAAYAEPAPKWSAQKVTSESAKPQPRGPTRGTRGTVRRIGWGLALGITLLLLYVLFWMVT